MCRIGPLKVAAYRPCSVLEGLDDATLAEQERVGDQTKRRQVDVARTGCREFQEAAIQRAILHVLALGLDLAVQRKARAAGREFQRAAVGLHDNVPGLWSGLPEIELGRDWHARAVCHRQA